MAAVHNQISRGDVTNAVTRALGVTKPDTGVERFSETLDVVMNPWGMPEWARLRGEQLGATLETVGAIAAEFGHLALINPANSGLLIVVEAGELRGSNAFLQIATEAVWAATLATAGVGTPRDTRGGPTAILLQPLRARILKGTDPLSALGSPIDFASTTIPFISLPVVLSPGWGVAMVSTVVATAFDGIFTWRERKAYPGEQL